MTVDARPSDAVNLALVAGIPILVHAGLLADPAATGRTDWRTYPTVARDLVGEIEQRMREVMGRPGRP